MFLYFGFRHFLTLYFILSIGFLVPLIVVAQENERPFYTYEGKRIYLNEESNYLSVGTNDGKSPLDSIRKTAALENLEAQPMQSGMWQLQFGTRLSYKDPNNAKSSLKESQAAALRERDALLNQLHFATSVEWAYPAYRNSQSGTLLFLTPQILVQTTTILTLAELEQRLPSTVRFSRRLRANNRQFVLELTDPKRTNPLTIAEELIRASSDWLDWAEPDFIQDWQKSFTPNDPNYQQQWHLDNEGNLGTPPGTVGADSRVEEGWDREMGDGSVVIAIIDDGVQLDHPDLQSQIFSNSGEIPANGIDDDNNGLIDDVNGWDFFDNDNNPNPILTEPSHGTAVAGVAAARGNNGVGVSGSCLNCQILPVRISGDVFASDAVLADAISYAGEFADVLNNSWGGGAPSSAISSAITSVSNNGRTGLGSPVLFATGNSASGFIPPSLSGIPPGTYFFEWLFQKDATVTAGLDAAWLDNVIFPDGTVEDFESCSIPAGWTATGDVGWTAVNDETRASSARGGNCSLGSGSIIDNQTSGIRVQNTVTSTGTLTYSVWPSAETNQPGGSGPIQIDDGVAPVECFDGVRLNIYDQALTLLSSRFFACGTFSNQGNPLQDGVVSFPASAADSIAVGSASNFDRRSDYSQWGPEVDFIAHSSGGSVSITTTDITGASGYSTTDYTDTFGGTSSATPLAAGIVGLLLTQQSTLTEDQVRQRLRDATRQIGPLAYSGGRNDNYGHGVLDASQLVANLVNLIFQDEFEQ